MFSLLHEVVISHALKRHILQRCKENTFFSHWRFSLCIFQPELAPWDMMYQARGPLALHNSSKIEQVILKFWSHSSSVKLWTIIFQKIPHMWPLLRTRDLAFNHSSTSTPTLPSISSNDGEWRCYSGNIPSKNENIQCHGSWNDLTFVA